MISLKNPYVAKQRQLFSIPLFTFPRNILQQSKYKLINTYKHLIQIDLIPINKTVMTLSSHHHHLWLDLRKDVFQQDTLFTIKQYLYTLTNNLGKY